MVRVTRSSRKAAAKPEPECNVLNVIDNNSTPEAEQQQQAEEEVLLPAKQAQKGKENTPAKTPAKRKKGKRGKKGAARKSDVIEEGQQETKSVAPAEAAEHEATEAGPELAGENSQAIEESEEPILEEPIIQEAPVQGEVASWDDETSEAAREQPPQQEAEKPDDSVASDPKDIVGEQTAIEEGQSTTVHVQHTQVEDQEEHQPVDEDDAIGVELQRMVDEIRGSVKPLVDEAVIETQLEQMSCDVQADAWPLRPQTPERHQTVLTIGKTPKFDPEIHGKDSGFDSPGNDSFELHISPRKNPAVAESDSTQKPKSNDLTQKPVTKTKKSAQSTTATKPKVKAKAIAPKPPVTVNKTVKPPITTVASMNSGVVRAKRPAPTATPSPRKMGKRTMSMSSQGSTASKRVITVSSQASDASKTSTVIIPHSKPRPIGMKFPPPPPRAKSSKLPTVSCFELPGEVFARRIQAQKEERRKRMEEEEKKRKEFKARPAPMSTFIKPASHKASSRASVASSGESMLSTCENTPDIKVSPSIPKNTSIVQRPHPTPEPQKLAAATIRSPPKDQLDRGAQAQAVLKARREAAERGRQTVRMWAEQQRQKEEKARAAGARDAAAPLVPE